MLKNVETIFGGNMSKPNKKDVQAYEDLMRKSLRTTMLAVHAKNLEKYSVDEIRRLSKLVGDPLHQSAEGTKTAFIGDKLVKVVTPEIEQQMAKQN